MKFTILVSFLGHCYYILSLSNLCMGVENKILKEIMHFHHMTYMTTPQHKNPCPRGHEIYNFGRPFLGHHYYILGLSNLCLGVEQKMLKEKMHFHNMTYMWPRPCTRTPAPEIQQFYSFYHKIIFPWGRGHEIYNFLSPYPTDATYQIWLRLARQFLRKRC